jgi:hypothetical protein
VDFQGGPLASPRVLSRLVEPIHRRHGFVQRRNRIGHCNVHAAAGEHQRPGSQRLWVGDVHQPQRPDLEGDAPSTHAGGLPEGAPPARVCCYPFLPQCGQVESLRPVSRYRAVVPSFSAIFLTNPRNVET